MDTNETKKKWRLVSPAPVVGTAQNRLCPHPEDLSGKTVLLYWNGKPNGDVFLNRLGELLIENTPDMTLIKAWEADFRTTQAEPTHAGSRAAASLLAGWRPDLVIGAPADCAGCTTWLVEDLLNLESQGIPTVTVVTSPFLEMARTVPLAQGFNQACLVEIAPPVGMLPSAVVREKAERFFADILKAATSFQPVGSGLAAKPPYPAEILSLEGTVSDVNRYFFKEKWSLGLPIIPPAPERVAEMLGGTSRKPEDILGAVPPGMGQLSVELVATYAAMAGCRPQYMPVLIAAAEALLSPEANWRLALTGTGTSQILVIVNGPIVGEIGIGCGQGAAGKGHHANGAIGYALNLIAFGVGSSRPPMIDRSTLGSPGDYVCWVFGENEQARPESWTSLHEDLGFQASDSVVTVMVGYPPVENVDHWSASAEEHLDWWGRIVSPLQNMGGPAVPQLLRQNPLVALGPEHAHLVAASGWSKSDFRKAFRERTRVPLSAWPPACPRGNLIELLGEVTEESLIPIALNAEQVMVVVAGGDGKQSHYFPPFPGSFPVSRPVDP